VIESPLYTLEAVGDVRGVGFSGSARNFSSGTGTDSPYATRNPASYSLPTILRATGFALLAVSPEGQAAAAALSYSGEVRFYGADDG
jgi:hypothetical protein